MTQQISPALSERYAELKEHILSSSAEAATHLECINEKAATIEKVGQIGVEGAVSLEERLRIQRDAAILGSLALQVDPELQHEGTRGIIGALSLNEPQIESQETFLPSHNGASPERRRRGGMAEKTKRRAGEAVKALINNGGAVEGYGKVSAATVLIEKIGLTPNVWVSLKKNLSNMELITMEKTIPTAKKISKISLNTQRALELVEAGELPSELKGHIEEALKESWLESKPTKPVAAPPGEEPQESAAEPEETETSDQGEKSTPLDEIVEDEPEDELEAQLEQLDPR